LSRKIAIVGRPKVGKTTLAKKLARELGINIHHTDDSIGEIDFKDADKYWINRLQEQENYIVEGVQVARMLRSGARDKSWTPDKVYIVDATHSTEPKHRGLAALCNDPVEKWCEDHPDIEVERIINDFELPRESFMSEARKQVDEIE
jgi:adenylate kinase family enzyme